MSFRIAVLLGVLAATPAAWSATAVAPADLAEGRAIFKQLIEINTTDSVGSVTAASQAMADRFRAAGFPAADVEVIGPNDRKKNLLLRYRSSASGKKPILIVAHLDVVEARRSDWTTDPFQFVEKDGYYYGRGTQDMKEDDAILVADLIRLRREGFRPGRDILLALTADEEGGGSNGVAWLLEHKPEMKQVAFAINPDGGGIDMEHGRPVSIDVEATEKLYADYDLTATNRGGHSSLPRPDNAIYELAAALGKLAHYQFPFELNSVTRAYFGKLADVERGSTADDLRAIVKDPPDPAAVARLSQTPAFNSNFRTTCVATRLQAGHAYNALPQAAVASVNCRILPGHSPEEVRRQLAEVFGDPKLEVKLLGGVGHGNHGERKALPPPPPIPEVFTPLTRIAQSIWPGVPVLPEMENGASDNVYLFAAGIPAYGFSGIALDRDDVRAHGRDERLPVDSFAKGLAFFYDFLRALGSE
ncbi:MAG TPA: M20/M25/M40 family metallo-hydrolase [Bryobacteraceae bacterium]|nr:M20/M25/M40 family metallo-hydrolase [Bryobacteraceae bacterium]